MNTHKLNDAQMVLLQLFQNRKMNQVEISLLKDVLVNHLTNELDLKVENVMKEKSTDVARSPLNPPQTVSHLNIT